MNFYKPTVKELRNWPEYFLGGFIIGATLGAFINIFMIFLGGIIGANVGQLILWISYQRDKKRFLK